MTHETQRRIEEEAEKYAEGKLRPSMTKDTFINGATFGYNLANEWVKVSEMLPEFEAWVLCYCGGNYI